MSLSRNLGRAISIAAIALAAPAIGQIKTGAGGGTEIVEAARPVDEGVPEVAVYQLQKLVTRLSGADAVKAKEKLAEALIAARRSTEALRLLDEPVLRDSTSGKFLRAQAFAALNRSSEALQLYREVANNNSVPQRPAAAFGAGEMLRALDRADEAIQAYHALENDPRFGISARLREAELFIAKQDSVMAKRILDGTQTKIATDKRQKRLLHARIELLNQRSEKAVGLLDSLVKKPENESRETAIAALFAMADAHLQMNTPEAGDDYLEDFIDRHPVDPALPQVFAKLDQVYRAERKPPRNELEKWARDAAQPRRGFARWYLAQSELRAGRREEANPAVRTNSKDNAGAGGACTRALTICAAANRGGESQRSARYPQRSGKNEPDAASARANRFRIGTRNVRGAEISGAQPIVSRLWETIAPPSRRQRLLMLRSRRFERTIRQKPNAIKQSWSGAVRSMKQQKWRWSRRSSQLSEVKRMPARCCKILFAVFRIIRAFLKRR